MDPSRGDRPVDVFAGAFWFGLILGLEIGVIVGFSVGWVVQS